MNYLFPAEILVASFAGIGLIVGSFLNVLIHRLPLMIVHADHEGTDPAPNLCFPASHCPSCGNHLRWFHNIPVLSYVFLRGKCGFCGVKISARYPLVELLTASVWIACLMGFGESSNPSQLPIQPLVWSVLGSLYIAMVFIDFETMLLPDVLTLGALWVAMLGALLNLSGISIDQSIYGAMSGYLFMRVFIFAGDKFMGRPSMGLGDAKLVAALGGLFGVTALPPILLISSVTGIFIYCILMLRKSTEVEYIPFGPALIAGALAHAMGASHVLHLI